MIGNGIYQWEEHEFICKNGSLYHQNKPLKNLGEGVEGVCFLFQDHVIKIYKINCAQERLSEQNVRFFSTLKFSRIILPEGIIFKDGKFCGYVDVYVKKDQRSFFSLTKHEFVQELNIWLQELKEISQYGIVLGDLCGPNFVLSEGALYAIDPGDYVHLSIDFDPNKVYQNNLDTFQKAILNLLFYDTDKKIEIKQRLQYYRKTLFILKNKKSLIQYFTEENFDTLQDYMEKHIKM